MLAATDDPGALVLSTTKNRFAEGFSIALKLDLNAGGFSVVDDPSAVRTRESFELSKSHVHFKSWLLPE